MSTVYAYERTHYVQRSMTVKVKAQDENGAKVSLSLTDFQARIFQHEYDHLQVCHHCKPCSFSECNLLRQLLLDLMPLQRPF